jgi:hypothetical protein
VLKIDLAVQRDLLDASIRRALRTAPAASRSAEEQKVARSEARPSG